jgi:dUTP pyrophosphatase
VVTYKQEDCLTQMSLYLWIPDENLRQAMRQHVSQRRRTDSGVDLLCPHHKFFNLPQNFLGREIRTGIIAAATHPIHGPVPYLLLARSSTSMTPLRMSNQIGLADAGYRGELIARVDYFGNEHEYEIPFGRRLFQIVQFNWLPFDKIFIVDNPSELPAGNDNRGGGGFGSTGA